MHKSSRRRVIAIVMLAVFAMLAFAPRTALAENFYDPFTKNASAVKNDETITMYMPTRTKSNTASSFSILDKTGKLSDASSENSKVIQTGASNTQLMIVAVKPGKAKVTYKYRGKKRTVNVVVKKYANAFKTLKIGNTNITKKLNSGSSAIVKGKLLRGKKLTVKPGSGWKVQKVQMAMGNGVFKGIKVGKTLPKKAFGLLITMRNTKDKGCIQYQIIQK